MGEEEVGEEAMGRWRGRRGGEKKTKKGRRGRGKEVEEGRPRRGVTRG